MTTLQQQARALGDPTRHEIFRRLADADGPVGVAALTAHFGLNHNAIRQHLAKLVAAGLVSESTAAVAGRGRPRLVYEVAPGTESRWGVTGPYERLSQLLVEVIRSGDTPVEVGRRAAGRHRVAAAPADDSIDDLAEAMAREGFEPEVHRRANRVDMVLRTCPYESAAVADPDTVCALHLGIAEGLAAVSENVEVDELVAKDPRRANCLLRLRIEPGA
jgi:predicted ArsR family transcriptional regulator